MAPFKSSTNQLSDVQSDNFAEMETETSYVNHPGITKPPTPVTPSSSIEFTMKKSSPNPITLATEMKKETEIKNSQSQVGPRQFPFRVEEGRRRLK